MRKRYVYNVTNGVKQLSNNVIKQKVTMEEWIDG